MHFALVSRVPSNPEYRTDHTDLPNSPVEVNGLQAGVVSVNEIDGLHVQMSNPKLVKVRQSLNQIATEWGTPTTKSWVIKVHEKIAVCGAHLQEDEPLPCARGNSVNQENNA